MIARKRDGGHVPNDPSLDVGYVRLADIQITEEPFQQIAGEDLPDDIEDLIGAEFPADLPEPVQQPGEDAPLVGVHGDEVQDHAIAFLTVTVDATHPLLKPDRATTGCRS